jgi:hypothetical protein
LVLALIRAIRADPGGICVDADATGNNDGSMWADAYTERQSALAAAVAGGVSPSCPEVVG